MDGIGHLSRAGERPCGVFLIHGDVLVCLDKIKEGYEIAYDNPKRLNERKFEARERETIIDINREINSLVGFRRDHTFLLLIVTRNLWRRINLPPFNIPIMNASNHRMWICVIHLAHSPI
jgi:hypothetical protein